MDATAASSVNHVDATSALAERPSRQPDYVAENGALSELAQVLADNPGSVAQALVEAALRLTGAHSAGLSLEEHADGKGLFRWVATAGEYERYLHGTLPRDFSPCGVVVDRNAAVLMQEPVRFYGYIADLHRPVQEVLLVPFHQAGKPIGTVWAVAHDKSKRFDSEDLRILQGLTRFAAAAVQTVSVLKQLSDANDTQRLAISGYEASLRKLTEWFQKAPGFVAYLSAGDLTFELANEAYGGIVGVASERLIGRPLLEAIPSLQGQGFDQLLRDVASSGTPYVGSGVPVALHPRGSGPQVTKFVDFVYQPVMENGKVQGIFVQGHECTDRVLAIAELEEQDKRKDDFMAALAHEMRTPLTAMSLSLHALRTGNDALRERTLGVIERQSAQLLALVEDMTDVAAIRKGKFDLRRSRVVAQDVVCRAVEACDFLAKTKRHVIRMLLDEEPAFLHADVVRLTQVIGNLVNNAIKYTPEGGEITLRLELTERDVNVSVADSGVGIDPDYLPYIFEMFVQVPSQDRPRRAGMGIGLAIVQQFVQMHGGDVQAFSEGRGKGSTFTVTLPRIR